MKLIITPILLSSILFSIEGIIVFNDQTIIEGDVKTIDNMINIFMYTRLSYHKITNTLVNQVIPSLSILFSLSFKEGNY